MGTVYEGIKTANELLTIFDNVLDRVIPWKLFNESLIELDKYRSDYSAESAALLGEIQALISDAIEGYYIASQSVYEWTGFVPPLLTAYISLFEQYTPDNASAQKFILLQVLEDCIKKLRASQEQLNKSSLSFNEATGKLAALHHRLEVEFEEKSNFVQTKLKEIRSERAGKTLFGVASVIYRHSKGTITERLMEQLEPIKNFYDELQLKADHASKDVEKITIHLDTGIHHISEVKVKTEEKNPFVETNYEKALFDTVIQSAEGFISKCNFYREEYSKKLIDLE